MRKSKTDQAVEGIHIYYFIQYFERHCLSSSRCYKVWLLETGTLQFKEEEFVIGYGTDAVRTNGFSFVG